MSNLKTLIWSKVPHSHMPMGPLPIIQNSVEIGKVWTDLSVCKRCKREIYLDVYDTKWVAL